LKLFPGVYSLQKARGSNQQRYGPCKKFVQQDYEESLATNTARMPRFLIWQSEVLQAAPFASWPHHRALKLHIRAPKGQARRCTRRPRLRNQTLRYCARQLATGPILYKYWQIFADGRKHQKEDQRQWKPRRQKLPQKCGFKNISKCIVVLRLVLSNERKIGGHEE